jgi:hypothetical protein
MLQLIATVAGAFAAGGTLVALLVRFFGNRGMQGRGTTRGGLL